MIFDLQGTLIIEHRWPKPGIKYVSNGRSADEPANPLTVTDDPIHQLSEMS